MAILLTTHGKAVCDSANEANPVVLAIARVSSLRAVGSPAVGDTVLDQHSYRLEEIAATYSNDGSNTVTVSFVIPNKRLRHGLTYRFGIFTNDDASMILSGTFVADTDSGGHLGANLFTEKIVIQNSEFVSGNIAKGSIYQDSVDVYTQLDAANAEAAVAVVYGEPIANHSVSNTSAFKTITGPVVVNKLGALEPRENLVTTVAVTADSASFEKAKTRADTHLILLSFKGSNQEWVNSIYAREDGVIWKKIDTPITELYRIGQYYIKETHTLVQGGGAYDAIVEFGIGVPEMFGNGSVFKKLFDANKYRLPA